MATARLGDRAIFAVDRPRPEPALPWVPGPLAWLSLAPPANTALLETGSTVGVVTRAELGTVAIMFRRHQPTQGYLNRELGLDPVAPATWRADDIGASVVHPDRQRIADATLFDASAGRSAPRRCSPAPRPVTPRPQRRTRRRARLNCRPPNPLRPNHGTRSSRHLPAVVTRPGSWRGCGHGCNPGIRLHARCARSFHFSDGRHLMQSREGASSNLEYLSPQQVAIELDVSVRTVYAWMSKRCFPYARLGKHARIRRADLETWIAANTLESIPSRDQWSHCE